MKYFPPLKRKGLTGKRNQSKTEIQRVLVCQSLGSKYQLLYYHHHVLLIFSYADLNFFFPSCYGTRHLCRWKSDHSYGFYALCRRGRKESLAPHCTTCHPQQVLVFSFQDNVLKQWFLNRFYHESFIWLWRTWTTN